MRKILVSLLLILTAILTSCSTSRKNIRLPEESKKLYKPVIAYKGVGIFKEAPSIKKELKPVDLAQEQLTVTAFKRINMGISIFVIAFVVSIAFANPLTHKLCDIGMGIGGLLFVVGMVKLFIAMYLLYICLGVFFLIIIAVVYRLRGRSVLRAGKWFKEKIKALKNKGEKSNDSDNEQESFDKD